MPKKNDPFMIEMFVFHRYPREQAQGVEFEKIIAPVDIVLYFECSNVSFLFKNWCLINPNKIYISPIISGNTRCSNHETCRRISWKARWWQRGNLKNKNRYVPGKHRKNFSSIPNSAKKGEQFQRLDEIKEWKQTKEFLCLFSQHFF